MDTNNSDSAANGLPSDADLASLAALLRAEDDQEHADKNLAEILARLDDANHIARQVEDNLDQLLELLDEMVQGLEAGRSDENATAGNESEKNVAPMKENLPQE